MRVAVVGAGLAGLAAARELTAGGHEVVVFEKSRGMGGRVAARRLGGTVLDHGSRVVAAPADSALRALVDSLAIDDRVDRGDGIAFAAGATRLPKRMAEGLDVRLGVRLAALRGAGPALELGDEQGNTHGTADAVIVTAPAPQAADLLERSPEAGPRVAALRAVEYAPAVMILVGLRLDQAEEWEVLDPEGPIAEVRREAVKGRVPIAGIEPLVVRLDEQASADLIDASDEAALDRALPALASLVRSSAEGPAWIQVKRWRFAVPIGRVDADAVNPDGVRIVVAGDSLTGAGFASSDHHRVYESGIQAARRVSP